MIESFSISSSPFLYLSNSFVIKGISFSLIGVPCLESEYPSFLRLTKIILSFLEATFLLFITFLDGFRNAQQ
jgi:hypothetical protein